jgi:hypothetical protein
MTPKQMRDAFNELQLRMRFDKQALKRGVDDSAAEDLFQLFKVQKPADDAAWFEEKSERFGFKGKTAAPTAAPATATTAPVEAPKPAAAPGAPSTHQLPTSNGLLDPFSMTPAQQAALGPQGMRNALEALWKIGNQMSGAPERPKAPQR